MSKFDLENYETVQERIETFTKLYPNGSILTDVFTETRSDGRVEWICKATVRKDAEGVICATGWASEYEGANKFAPHNACELAETSARGRALLAIGIGQQASRDEVASARSKEATPKPVPQDDPWAKGMEILGDALGAEPLANQTVTKCSHGVMVYKTGVSKKTGKPWGGHFCPDNVQLCDTKWQKVG
jgi:hypothetical protein